MSTDDGKFERVQPGAPWWYWNATGTGIAKVVRDGSGRLWSDWGDERGSTRLPDGPAVLPYNACLCVDLERCQARGAALAIVRDQLRQAMQKIMTYQTFVYQFVHRDAEARRVYQGMLKNVTDAMTFADGVL